jgi:predicted DCC family thiol-disulfide oxidoreductase YuxK
MRNVLPISPYAVPWQWADLTALEVDEAECREAVQYFDDEGQRWSAGAAVAHVLADQPRVWGAIGRALDSKALRQVNERAYRWVAANRYRLPGGTAACALTPAASAQSQERSTR